MSFQATPIGDLPELGAAGASAARVQLILNLVQFLVFAIVGVKVIVEKRILSNRIFKKLAAKHKPPQSWYDEDHTGLY